MKKQLTILFAVIIVIIGASYGLNYIMGDDSNSNKAAKYCGVMKGGKLVVMHEGTELKEDVTLPNGLKIRKDGIVIKKDGSQLALKDGECIDMEGKVKKDDKNMPDDDKNKPNEDKDNPNYDPNQPNDTSVPKERNMPKDKKSDSLH
jgi:hypothetical protein